MFYIYCPYCQEYRDEQEFNAAGQAQIARPQDADNCSDEQWGRYLYFRKNPCGQHREMWLHAAGCRKYFTLSRDTRTYEINAVYRMGEQADREDDGVVDSGEPA